MMRQLRESTKIIMIIVSIAFVGLMVFEWGMDLSGTSTPTGGPTTLGSVNGAEITLQDFQRQYQILYQQAAGRSPSGLTSDQIDAIEEEAWEDVVTLTLLRQEAESRGIEVSDTEVVEYVKYSPPSDIVDLPAFQTEGRFDIQKYHRALADPTLRETWTEYEAQVRRSLPIQKLEEQVVGGVEVTDAELRNAWRERTERARIAYLHLNEDVLVPDERISISPDEVRTAYDENREDYRREASARARWVSFRPAVTAADSARVRALADSLAAVARQPAADFADLVEDHTDDPITAETGGDLGWIRSETMDPALAAVLRDAEPGQILGPVQTPFGWHVLRFDDRQTQEGETRVRASQILLAVEPTAEAVRTAREAAQEFARAAGVSADAFDAAAAERGLEVRTTPAFERGIVVPGLGPAPAVAEFLFSNDPGSVSGPLERDGAYHVFRVDERYPAGYVAFDRVAERIHAELVRREKRERVEAMAPEIAEVVRQRGLEGAAERYGLQVVTTSWFNRVNNIPGIGSGTPVAGAAFGLAVGQTGGPVEALNGWYFLRVLEKETFDPQEFETQRPQLVQQLRQQKMQQVFTAWFANLRERAEIEDRRAELLGS